MEVKLIYYPGKEAPVGMDTWFAASLLAFTKNTRLNMTPAGLDEWLNKTCGELMNEMEYMSTSIPSSWEFVDCIFAINGISRATAQQVTRTRTATFAMQSQRVTDMSQVTWEVHPDAPEIGFDGYSMHPRRSSGDLATFDDLMRDSIDGYSSLVKAGMPLEDARDLLPIGVHCNLVAKYNLRTLVDLCRNRERSLRVQGPYQELVRRMREEVEAVWPWAHHFFADPHEKARAMLAEVAKELQAEGGAMYKGHAGKIAKALDMLSK